MSLVTSAAIAGGILSAGAGQLHRDSGVAETDEKQARKIIQSLEADGDLGEGMTCHHYTARTPPFGYDGGHVASPTADTLGMGPQGGHRYEQNLASRPLLDDETFYSLYYQRSDIRKDIPARVRKVIAEQLSSAWLESQARR